MTLPRRFRGFRAIAALALAFGALLPAAHGSVAQTSPLILRAGTDQKLSVLNPFNSVVVSDFEVYTLNYDLLVNFGPDTEPVPGFAESWSASSDGKTWTFKIRPGMKWSDGQPATAEDARYTYQLIIDATKLNAELQDGFTLGAGYLEPYLVNAGVASVSAPDPQTLVVTTAFSNTLLTQAYVPILPKHVWSKYTIQEIANATDATPFTNEPPVVGSGPYQAVEWTPGQQIRFVRNKDYWGKQGAADEVILIHFESGDTAAQALKRGEIDYARDVLPDTFKQLKTEPNITTVEGLSNGYTQLSFNTKGNTQGFGGSTAALTDPKFRDALGYAVDQQKLVDSSLGGYGTPGSTIIPPFHTRWHVEPARPRRFDIEEAKRRLDAAGYKVNAAGKRLDKAGKVLNLRLTWPDSQETGATDAQFLAGWFTQLGITIDAAVTEEGKLTDELLAPPDGPANYDLYMWGWVGDPDPTSLLDFFRTSAIAGGTSDSYYSNPRYDQLFELQRAEPDPEKRLEYLAEMQNLVYDEAPYIVLYYDSDLHAYRTDKFAGWQNQPRKTGTPLFGYGSIGYTLLTDATAPTPAPSTTAEAPAPSSGATPAPSAGTPAPVSGGSDMTVPIVGGLAVLVLVVGGVAIVMRRRGPSIEDE